MRRNLLLLLTALLPMVATAYDAEIDGIYYNFISEDEAEVTYYEDPYQSIYSGAVVIPEAVTYNGTTYRVTSVGNGAFDFCRELISVTIPEGVRTIGRVAFQGCDALTIVTLPNSLVTIGYAAFNLCDGLTSINIPENVTNIEGLGFWNCNNLTAVHITDLAAWFNISFGDVAANPLLYAQHLYLNGQEIKDLVFPENMTNIGNYAFCGCIGLTSINIPNSVTSIGDKAFYACSGLTSITIEKGNTIYDSRNDCNAIIETATNILIVGCQNTIIPNSVTGIGDYAFFDCSGLISINIPNSVTSIGDYAFYRCTGLTSITIPNSVTKIGSYVFISCYSLKEIYCYAEEAPEVSSNCFSNVDVSKVLLVVPDGAVEKYKAHEVWGQFWIETPTRMDDIEHSPLNIEHSGEDWYDLSGRKLDKPQNGINIIRRNDGTTRKVVKR